MPGCCTERNLFLRPLGVKEIVDVGLVIVGVETGGENLDGGCGGKAECLIRLQKCTNYDWCIGFEVDSCASSTVIGPGTSLSLSAYVLVYWRRCCSQSFMMLSLLPHRP